MTCSFTLNREAWAVLIVLDKDYNFKWVSPFDPAGSKYAAGAHSIPWAGQLAALADGPYIPIIYAADADGNSDFGFAPAIFVHADNGADPTVSNLVVTPGAGSSYAIDFDVDKYHMAFAAVVNSTGAWLWLPPHDWTYAGHESFLWDGTEPTDVGMLGPISTERVSVGFDGSPANGHSFNPSVSADGRFVAFESNAFNLVPGDTNAASDVFVYNRETGATTRVSVTSDGGEGWGPSSQPSISSDGRYVAFVSEASNLVPGDTNSMKDVFIHDRQTGETTRASVAPDGSQGNGDSEAPAISANGQYVVFESRANNLLPGTNASVFLYDRSLGPTSLTAIGDGDSDNPAISGDGRYVAFRSGGFGLVPGDTNGLRDIFVFDNVLKQMTRVSVASDGTQGDGHSYEPRLSPDGRYVSFSSWAATLVPGDTNLVPDVFVHDRDTGQTVRVSVASDGGQGNGPSTYSPISEGGRYVSFYSTASNLVLNDTNGRDDVFVHDRQTGQTLRASVTGAGSQGDNHSRDPSISADGRLVAFSSDASNLVPGDINGVGDIFVAELGTSQPLTYWFVGAAIDAFNRGGGCYIGPDMGAPECFTFAGSSDGRLSVAGDVPPAVREALPGLLEAAKAKP